MDLFVVDVSAAGDQAVDVSRVKNATQRFNWNAGKINFAGWQILLRGTFGKAAQSANKVNHDDIIQSRGRCGFADRPAGLE